MCFFYSYLKFKSILIKDIDKDNEIYEIDVFFNDRMVCESKCIFYNYLNNKSYPKIISS